MYYEMEFTALQRNPFKSLLHNIFPDLPEVWHPCSSYTVVNYREQREVSPYYTEFVAENPV